MTERCSNSVASFDSVAEIHWRCSLPIRWPTVRSGLAASGSEGRRPFGCSAAVKLNQDPMLVEILNFESKPLFYPVVQILMDMVMEMSMMK